MVDFNTLQDAVNGYRYLEDNTTESDYRFVLQALSHSCNPTVVNYVNQASPYSTFAVDMLRVFLYEYARDSMKNFIQQGAEQFNRQDYYTVLLTIREMTKDKNLQNEANNLLTQFQNSKNDTSIMPNQITDLCMRYVNLS